MEDFYGKFFWKIEKKNFGKIFTIFFFFFFSKFFFGFSFFFINIFNFFFLFRAGGREERVARGCWRAKRAAGGVGERSEPPAGGLAVGAEGSVNSEFN